MRRPSPDPKNKPTSKVRIEGNVDNKTVFAPYPDSQNSPFGPQKAKTDHKIRSKVKIRVERNIRK